MKNERKGEIIKTSISGMSVAEIAAMEDLPMEQINTDRAEEMMVI